MKKTISLALLIFFALVFSFEAMAQTAAVQKAAKAVFTLTTYRQDGSILATTHGAYFANADEGISAFKPFDGAYRAEIIDANGKRATVEAIIGANDMYDICRFRLSAKGSAVLLPATGSAQASNVFVAGYSTKKPTITALNIKSSESFLDKYNYYTFKEEINENIEGCPILTADGLVLGLAQRATTSYDIHSTDARYYSDLTTSGLSVFDAVLNKTHIRAALPSDHEQARLMLLMFNAASDSLNVVACTNEYISLYPSDIDGYSAMAKYEVTHGNLEKASASMETAVNKVANKDEALFEYAKLVYNFVIYNTDSTLTAWTLAKAEELAKKAVATNNLPFYTHLLAQIKYSQQQYEEAFNLFGSLTDTEISTSEIYYEMAQSKEQLGATDEEVMEYIGKAVVACPQPLTQVSAPYILARGMMYERLNKPRLALKDYNTYDTLMNFRASADFYYTRFKCELGLRQFQQAIEDISHAAVLSPGNVTYLAKLASVNLRVKQFDRAIQACDLALRFTEEYADIYIIKGVALQQLGNNAEALENFNKAKELGDERAERYIEKL